VQRRGGPVEDIRPGDAVWIAADEKHWHGAAPNTSMTHIAIQKGRTEVLGIGWSRLATSNSKRKQRRCRFRVGALRALRQRIPAFVQALRRYCTTVRLPVNVHVGLLDHVLLQPALHNCMSGVDGTSRFSRVKFPCMLGSSTAQSPINARDFALIGVAFRTLEQRRRSDFRPLSWLNNPACMFPCQRFTCSLATARA